MALLETALGLGVTSGVGYMAYVHRRLHAHDTALAATQKELEGLRARIDMLDTNGAMRHKELREDLSEVREAVAGLTRHLLSKAG